VSLAAAPLGGRAAPPGPGERAVRQLVLDLPPAEGTGLADFLPAPSNRAALEAVLAWPSWPSALLLLAGPEGSGKSHLAAIWAERAAAVRLRGQDLVAPETALARLGPAAAALCDDADAAPEERALLHLANAVVERRGHLLLTARADPAGGWPALPDLRSRLAAAGSVRIEPPDQDLLAALLVKQLADRGLRVEPGVVELLATRMERSFAAARRLVRALDRASLGLGRAVGPALARAVLAALEAEALEAEPDEGPAGRA
jgi:chromosomal replication initiation ATPase DnaA